MSRSIHQTVKGVAKANTKRELTPDNPDLIALAQKTRYKLTAERRRAEAASPVTQSRKPRQHAPRVK